MPSFYRSISSRFLTPETVSACCVTRVPFACCHCPRLLPYLDNDDAWETWTSSGSHISRKGVSSSLDDILWALGVDAWSNQATAIYVFTILFQLINTYPVHFFHIHSLTRNATRCLVTSQTGQHGKSHMDRHWLSAAYVEFVHP